MNTDINRRDLVLTLGQRLMLFACIFIICYIITTVLVVVLGHILAGRGVAALRIGTIVQDVIAFIVPAVATAVIVCRRPADLLCLRLRPQPTMVLLAIVALIVSEPAQEAVIYWNYNWQLPQSMAGLARALHELEDTAAAAMRLMLADTGVPSLIVNLLVVGVAAGVAEELLFRGCFQRLLITGGVNRHVAIWVVAVCFSAMHMQLFGFVPRMLLGAYFGYMLLWSRSIWVPVIAHVFNNMAYVATAWVQVRRSGAEVLDQEPTLWNWWLTAGSAVLASAAIYAAYRLRNSHELGAEA